MSARNERSLRAPGWYRDPGNPTVLRHWNGAGWDPRRRDLPGWALGTNALDSREEEWAGHADGPVTPAALPAAASSWAAGPARAPRTPPVADARTAPPAPTAGNWHARPNRPLERPWATSRSPVLVGFVLLGLVVLALVSAVAGSRSQPTSPAPLDQATVFLDQANAACATQIASARTGTAPSVAAVKAANSDLDGLAQRLQVLSGGRVVRGEIQGWLDDWQAYAVARGAVAAFTASRPAPSAANHAHAADLDAASEQAATAADAFAQTNGLSDCTLAPVPPAPLTSIP